MVTGQNDAVLDGDTSYGIVFEPAVSSDPSFAGIKPRDIAVVNLEDACASEQVTGGAPANSVRPAFDGAGQLLAFSSQGDFAGLNGDGNREIFLYHRATGTFSQVTDTTSGSSEAPSLDSAGSSLALASTADLTGTRAGALSEVFLYDIGTGAFTQLTVSTGTGSGSAMPAVSDDGTVVAFISDADFSGENPDGSREAFLYDTAATTITQVSDDAGNDPNAHVDFVAVDGTGTKVVYTKQLATRSLFVYDVPGAAATLLDSGDTASPAVSEDGTRIAFVSDSDPIGQNPDGNGEAFVFTESPAESGSFMQVTDTAGDDVRAVSLSADGNRVALVTNADLLGENADGGNELFSYDIAKDALIQATTRPGPADFDGLAQTGNGFRLAYSTDGSGTFEIRIAHLPDPAVSYPLWPSQINILDLILLGGTCD